MSIDYLPNRDSGHAAGSNGALTTKRRWLWPALSAVLALVAAALAASLVYTNNSAEAWQTQAQQRAEALVARTAERDAKSAELKTVTTKLGTTTEKYNQAAARIRALADEKAQVGDRAAVLAEVTAQSKTVTTELDACVEQLQQLQGYLINYDLYDPDAVVSVVQQVNDGCNSAQDDNAALVELIAGL